MLWGITCGDVYGFGVWTLSVVKDGFQLTSEGLKGHMTTVEIKSNAIKLNKYPMTFSRLNELRDTSSSPI